jgi:hypothetical protein
MMDAGGALLSGRYDEASENILGPVGLSLTVRGCNVLDNGCS